MKHDVKIELHKSDLHEDADASTLRRYEKALQWLADRDDRVKSYETQSTENFARLDAVIVADSPSDAHAIAKALADTAWCDGSCRPWLNR